MDPGLTSRVEPDAGAEGTSGFSQGAGLMLSLSAGAVIAWFLALVVAAVPVLVDGYHHRLRQRRILTTGPAPSSRFPARQRPPGPERMFRPEAFVLHRAGGTGQYRPKLPEIQQPGT